MATKALDHQTSGEAWLRFYNWVPASVQVASNFSVGILSEVEFPYNGFEIRMSSTSVELNGTGIGVLASPTPTVFPRDRWVCVELHVTIDPVHGRYEAYLDGALVLQSAGLNTLPANGYSAAEVGVHYAPPSQGPVDVYVDDVFVARARIPCD